MLNEWRKGKRFRVHDRTINKTSSEEEGEGEPRRNPLDNIAEEEDEGEGNENIPVGGNPAVGNHVPVQIVGNPNNPASDDDDDNMANNAVKPGQLMALPTFDGERGERFTNWLECLENANNMYGWPVNSLIQVVKAKGGPRVAE